MKDISSDALLLDSLKLVKRNELVIKEFQNFSWLSLSKYDWSEYDIEGWGPARGIVLENNGRIYLLQYLEIGQVMLLTEVPPVQTWFNNASIEEIDEMVALLGLTQYQTFNNEFYFFTKEKKIQTEIEQYIDLPKEELKSYIQKHYVLNDEEVNHFLNV